ncbi:MAG: alpha/beta hydrolase [Actinomycetota bacterium]|nr:alpha/beta hydrolase [Actinomycetota bacterium]
MPTRVLALVCLLSLIAACGSSGADGTSAGSTTSGSAAPDPTSTSPTQPTSSSNPITTSAEGTVAPSTTVALRSRAVIAYGDGPSQFGELWLPDADGPSPVVVLVHGGFWRDTFGLDLMDDLAADLVATGRAVWNIEYRRVGEPGGGWPGTLDDVAAAVDHIAVLAGDHPLDPGRLAIVGHSAGGHLALWAAGRASLAADAPGGGPRVVPAIAVGLAPVVDLVGAAEDGVGLGAVDALLGGAPDELPDHYDVATPALTGDVPVVVVRGDADIVVPDPYTLPPGALPAVVEVVDVAGADHFDLIDPGHEAWAAVVERLAAG